MPWRETLAMDERLRFVQDVHRPGWSIAELCRRYEVSRKTGYKWLRAYERGGPAALADGSHRPLLRSLPRALQHRAAPRGARRRDAAKLLCSVVASVPRAARAADLPRAVR